MKCVCKSLFELQPIFGNKSGVVQSQIASDKTSVLNQ